MPSACLSPRLYRRERVGSLLVMSLRKNRRRYWGHVAVLMGRNVPVSECVSVVACWKVEAWMVFHMAVGIGVSTFPSCSSREKRGSPVWGKLTGGKSCALSAC